MVAAVSGDAIINTPGPVTIHNWPTGIGAVQFGIATGAGFAIGFGCVVGFGSVINQLLNWIFA